VVEEAVVLVEVMNSAVFAQTSGLEVSASRAWDMYQAP